MPADVDRVSRDSRASRRRRALSRAGARDREPVCCRAAPARARRCRCWCQQVDEDGNERAGIRLPDVAVPLATYTGWNFRKPEIGAPGELVPLLGSSIPFPATRAAREAAKDPRRSIEERYRTRDEYLARVEQALDALVLKGYLIYDDRTADPAAGGRSVGPGRRSLVG